jgi:Na+/melibiose symporter-like transporter
MVPLSALLPELAVLDRHRVRVTMWSATFQLMGAILAGLAGILIDHFSFVQMALIYTVIILPSLYLPLLVLREQPGRQIDASQRFGFVRSLMITLRNRAFLFLSATGIFVWTATSFLMVVTPYIVTEICLREGLCRFPVGLGGYLTGSDAHWPLVPPPIDRARVDLDHPAIHRHVGDHHAAPGLCCGNHRL